MSFVDKVRSKMVEYGLEIYDEYPIVDGEEYVFLVEDMILFVSEEKKTIGVSFQAPTRPEQAANMVLILNEIETGELDVMESFIFDRNNRFISGDKAFDLIEKTKESKTIQEFLKQQTYNEILLSSKCFEC